MSIKAWIKLVAILGLLALFLSGRARAEAIRDLVTIQNTPPITIEGVGIVTGLANTGDKKTAAQELLRKYLSNNNIDLETASLAVGNIAIVRVSAQIPPFSRPGAILPASVTSIGDAKNLEGGELLACDLFYAGSPYPMGRATGHVVVGQNVLTRGNLTAGNGSGVEQLGVYPFGNIYNDDGGIRLNLNRSNWADAAAIARQINQTPYLNPNLQETTMFADPGPIQPIAYAKDAGQVLVYIPSGYRGDKAAFVASMLDVPVTLDRPARILINRAKNSIVLTGDIRVNQGWASIQDRTVTLQPGNAEQPPRYTLENETPRNLVELEGPGSSADLQGLIDTMNAMGLTTAQVITMFEQLYDAGAIKAEFISQ